MTPTTKKEQHFRPTHGTNALSLVLYHGATYAPLQHFKLLVPQILVDTAIPLKADALQLGNLAVGSPSNSKPTNQPTLNQPTNLEPTNQPTKPTTQTSKQSAKAMASGWTDMQTNETTVGEKERRACVRACVRGERTCAVLSRPWTFGGSPRARSSSDWYARR